MLPLEALGKGKFCDEDLTEKTLNLLIFVIQFMMCFFYYD